MLVSASSCYTHRPTISVLVHANDSSLAGTRRHQTHLSTHPRAYIRSARGPSSPYPSGYISVTLTPAPLPVSTPATLTITPAPATRLSTCG
ncbi:uncharacterized protein LACBIDRAFT_301327 [Laccaria bicolor S238N-H82]|uniref:Predicted protein n=1 Tax=Laccaria bicolor (strain S238N-H82 / ATCC MYA-4686) TaxID=486041 RepID=B0CNA2_LACBS|nr:uncharacterized protein LACBIDRAFT_301327 [Laccaria bicolor S238N-H82]EDR15895.1 predicted protein [Laccaria bicolor S238N-H82]|eukprot:XP_001874103.1 predicted protein [Laccaria bicolor S238N-H82]